MIKNLDKIVSQVMIEIDEKWTPGGLHKISKLIDDDLLKQNGIPTQRPTRSAFLKAYNFLYSESDVRICIHEAVMRAVNLLHYCAKPDYFELKENFEKAVKRASHQQFLQDRREDKGLLGNSIPKGKR